MKVRISAEAADRLNRFVSETGYSTDDLVNEAVQAHLDQLNRKRQMLDSRNDDLKTDVPKV